ncbi:MAG: bifunctional ornithine acetyltransferase/N-acetylglutamate synthase, partial [Rectinema sp.]
EVCKGGSPLPFSEEKAKKILGEQEVSIYIDIHAGSCEATAWGCDLSYEYVRINGDYRT